MKQFLMVILVFAILVCHITGGIQGKIIEEISQQNTQLKSQVDVKERFELIYGSLKDVHNDYLIDVMKAIALLVICLGWLITSGKGRDFFKNNITARVSSIIILVLLCVININTSIRAYRFSQDKITELSILNYIEPKYYENYEISTEFLVANLIVHTALFALLAVILWTLKEVTHKT
jgi:hypothetical protein